MKLVNLYSINGVVDFQGNYIPAQNAKTIIAECTNHSIDYGCYYFAFLTYVKTKEKTQPFSLGFIEINNLVSFFNTKSSANFQKLALSDEVFNDFESYIQESYKARNKVHKLDISVQCDSKENINDKTM